jgi:predicted DNA-binding transcriptional regulator AlpA
MGKLLSAKQVAEHIGMHPKTLYKHLRNGTIPLKVVHVHGDRIGFRPEDVEEYLKDRTINPGIRKRRKPTVLEQLRQKHTLRDIMTDKEAQDFFEDVDMNPDFPD